MPKSEQTIHTIFDISLALKAVFSALEIVGGILAYFVSQDFILDVVTTLTADELAQDPHDVLANALLHAAQGFSVSAQHFAALYLVSHGVLKLFVIAGLLREKIWYYPLALAVFSGFIAYQLYRFTFTHSLWLLALTALDLAVVWLTWHEWRFLKRGGRLKNSAVL